MPAALAVHELVEPNGGMNGADFPETGAGNSGNGGAIFGMHFNENGLVVPGAEQACFSGGKNL